MKDKGEMELRRSVPRSVPSKAVKPVQDLYRHMIKHRIKYGQVSAKSGVRCETIARWSRGHNPNYFLLESVLNAVGMTLVATPLDYDDNGKMGGDGI